MREYDEEGVVTPDEQQVDRVVRVRVERLSEGLGDTCAQDYAQVDVVTQHE